MNRDEIVAFFVRRDAAWQRHDTETLTSNHANNGEVESPIRGHVEGREGIHDVYTQWFASFPDASYVTEQLVIDGNNVAQFVRMAGVQKGDFCGLPPSGKRFEMRCAFLFSFAGDRIAREVRIYDLTGILVQLGVLKVK